MSTLHTPVEVTITEKNKRFSTEPFSSHLLPFCTLQRISDFSYLLHHFHPLSTLQVMDVNLFKSGIKAMWEDNANISGGKILMRLNKVVSQRIFEKIATKFVAMDWLKNKMFNGIVLSIRPKHCMVAVWVRSVPSVVEWEEIKKEIEQLVGSRVQLEFKRNDELLKELPKNEH